MLSTAYKRRTVGFKSLLRVICLRISKTYCSKTNDVNLGVHRIRNVGVLAHIDAGKTTTTERMLYYSGFLSKMGNVDDGSTTMDYLKQEKERGITINAAAITFPWKEFQLNLIDTPGHIDFTFEVERSLRVLDGAVVVLNGSSGVESQTTSVWIQADRYRVPRIVFINKMDHPKSNSKVSVDSLRTKLKANPLVIQLPIETSGQFSGIVDLVSMQMLIWELNAADGSIYKTRPFICNQKGSTQEVKDLFIKDNSQLTHLSVDYLGEVYEYRSQLVEQLAMNNNDLLEVVLADSYNPLKLNEQLLKSCIKNVTMNCLGVPVLFGSALKNKGIQPLLDSITQYLPSPQEKSLFIPETLKDLFAFAFKVTHDPQRGPLVYLRIYSGAVKPQSTIYNITQRKQEKVTRVILMLADEQREMQQICEGNIAVVVGMKHTVTGDTLVQSIAVADQLPDQCSNEQLQVLQCPQIPEPMFFCTIEPLSAADQSALDHALACLSREDPSLIVTSDIETGQTVLSGMGELHLDIILNRIKTEYKVDASLGRLQVAYREAPTKSTTINETFSFNSGNRTHSIDISLTVVPSDQSQPKVVFPTARSALSFPSNLMCRDDLFAAVSDGIKTATLRGPLFSFPLSQLNVIVDTLLVSPGTPLIKITNILTTCVSKALSQADVILLEPFVHLEVVVSEVHLQAVLSDLVRARRGVIKSVEDHQDLKRVSVVFPVASLSGYSTTLRTMTSGMARFGSQFSHYEPVSDQRMRAIHKEITGFSAS